MWWWIVVEVVTFVLPHVARAIDLIASKVNKHGEVAVLTDDSPLRSEMSWLLNLFKKLLGDNAKPVTDVIACMNMEDPMGAFKHLRHCESLLKAKISDQVLKPLMGNGTAAIKSQSSDDYVNLVTSVVKDEFGGELSMYQYRNPNSQCCVNNLDMNPFEKNEVLRFLHLLDLLSTKRELIGLMIDNSPTPRSWITVDSLLGSTEELRRHVHSFYHVMPLNAEGKSTGAVMLFPKFTDFTYSMLLDIYPTMHDPPIVEDVLTAMTGLPWVQMDPNLCRNALMDKVLNGQYSFFRSMIHKLNLFLKTVSDRNHTLDDLSNPISINRMLESSRDYGFADVDDYINNLRIYAVGFAALLAANWQDTNPDKNASKGQYNVGSTPYPHVARPTSPWAIYPGVSDETSKALQRSGESGIQKLKRVLSLGRLKSPEENDRNLQGSGPDVGRPLFYPPMQQTEAGSPNPYVV